MKKIRRARTEAAKETRQTTILKAAKELVNRDGFQALTMDKVAKKCKLAKATMYIYFQRREDLLLAILREDFQMWFQKFRKYLEQSQQPFSEGLIQVWTQSAQENSRLITGLLFLHLQFEANMNEDFAFEWKNFLLSQFRDIHYLLLTRFEVHLTLKELVDFFVMVTGLTLGLWAQSQLHPTVQKIYLRHSDLAVLHTDFQKLMHTALQALLHSPELNKLTQIKAQTAT